MDKNMVTRTDDLVKIDTILVSVSDKSGLDTFIPGLLAINPGVRILSTGGTYRHIQGILGSSAPGCLEPVSQYTGQPETQGGLVKTLDFKIYLGLLTETYNSDHQTDLERTGAVSIDMVVVNLYPFAETIQKEGVTCEHARGNIDIGGPTMIRASAKNFIRVASVVAPGDYGPLLQRMEQTGGRLGLQDRFALARKAFNHTALYDTTIAGYLAELTDGAVAACYSTGA